MVRNDNLYDKIKTAAEICGPVQPLSFASVKTAMDRCGGDIEILSTPCLGSIFADLTREVHGSCFGLDLAEPGGDQSCIWLYDPKGYYLSYWPRNYFQCRFPRSKKRRIRKKWAKDFENYRIPDFIDRTIYEEYKMPEKKAELIAKIKNMSVIECARYYALEKARLPTRQAVIDALDQRLAELRPKSGQTRIKTDLARRKKQNKNWYGGTGIQPKNSPGMRPWNGDQGKDYDNSDPWADTIGPIINKENL